MRNLTHTPLLFSIVLAYLLLTIAYVFAVPLWEAPDEPAHFSYINYFADTGVPQPPVEWIPGGWLVNVTNGYEWYQTPLYYWLGSMILRANRDLHLLPPFVDFPTVIATPLRVFTPTAPPSEPHLGRFLSTILGLITIVITYKLAKKILPAEQWLPELAAGFTAFIPQYTFLHAYINNDSLAICTASFGLLYLVILALEDSPPNRRQWLVAGLASAPALASKMTTWTLLPLAGTLVLLNLRRDRRSLQNSMFDLFVFGTSAISLLFLCSLFWPDIFQRLLGSPHSTGIQPEFLTISYFVELIPLTHSSFWGHFGWMNLPIPTTFLLLLDVIGLTGLVSAMIFLAKRTKSITRGQRNAIAILCLATVWTFVFYILFNLATVQPQGRYFYTSISAIGFFVSFGWISMTGPHRKAVVLSILALMLTINILTLMTVIFPTYGFFAG